MTTSPPTQLAVLKWLNSFTGISTSEDKQSLFGIIDLGDEYDDMSNEVTSKEITKIYKSIYSNEEAMDYIKSIATNQVLNYEFPKTTTLRGTAKLYSSIKEMLITSVKG